MSVEVVLGDCMEVLPTLPANSFDAVVTDPPYPRIRRPYGYWAEDEWLDMMLQVLDELRRVLKPTGSALVIIQPNQEKMGRMALWPWRFVMEAAARGHRLVQDAYWLNVTPLPSAPDMRGGLLRPSLKWCLWFGPEGCYRKQTGILWSESYENKVKRLSRRASGEIEKSPSGRSVNTRATRAAAEARGGVSPFNVLPWANECWLKASRYGHPALLPIGVAQWWIRYICPPSGTVLDPFGGSGTTAIAAMREGRNAVLIERVPEYVDIAKRRIAEEQAKLAAQPGGLFDGSARRPGMRDDAQPMFPDVAEVAA